MVWVLATLTLVGSCLVCICAARTILGFVTYVRGSKTQEAAWSEIGFAPADLLDYMYEYAPNPEVDPSTQSFSLLPITTTDELG